MWSHLSCETNVSTADQKVSSFGDETRPTYRPAWPQVKIPIQQQFHLAYSFLLLSSLNLYHYDDIFSIIKGSSVRKVTICGHTGQLSICYQLLTIPWSGLYIWFIRYNHRAERTRPYGSYRAHFWPLCFYQCAGSSLPSLAVGCPMPSFGSQSLNQSGQPCYL